MVVNLGARIGTPEFVVGHVRELVELQLVRFIHLVRVVDVHDVGFEHVESPVFLVEASRNRMVAPPSLVQIPQALLR